MKLNLCSGPNVFGSPWINFDRVDQRDYIRIMRDEYRSPEMRATLPENQRRLAEYLGAGGKIDFRVHDVRSPLAMFADGTVDAIYLGQCVEHMTRTYELPNLLHECYELLRPGGRIRITTPDLDILLDAYRLGRMHQFNDEQPAYYAKAAPADQLAFLMFGAGGGDCSWDNYEGHFHCYTRGTIATVLTEAGFVGPYEFGAPSEAFEGVVDCGESHSIFVEAAK